MRRDRRRLCLAAAAFAAQALVAGAGAAQAQAQAQNLGATIVVDKDRVLRESEVAGRLLQQERAARSALQKELEALNAGIEAEEAELTELRPRLAKEEFDARVRAFNDKVQAARRTFQEKNEAIQREFVAARRRVSEALNPVLRRILEQTGGAIVIDSRGVLMASSAVDKTNEAIRLFDEATQSLFPSVNEPPAAEE